MSTEKYLRALLQRMHVKQHAGLKNIFRRGKGIDIEFPICKTTGGNEGNPFKPSWFLFTLRESLEVSFSIVSRCYLESDHKIDQARLTTLTNVCV